MRIRSICVLGGTGFVGTRLVARLVKEGQRVTVLSRDREQHKHMLVLPGLALENCDVYDPAQLAEQFRGQDAVINLVGILNERGFGGGGFRRTHTELTRGALQAARSAGVARFLQMSALNAAPEAPSHYLRSKGEAERLIRDQSGGPAWTIFQPSVIFGPGDSFLNRFASLLATLPLVFPLARADARFQPVYVDDVVAAMTLCLTRSDTGRARPISSGEPKTYSLRDIVCGPAHSPVIAGASSDCRILPPGCRPWSWISCPAGRFPRTTTAHCRSTAYAPRMDSPRWASVRNRWNPRPDIISAHSRTTRASAATVRQPGGPDCR